MIDTPSQAGRAWQVGKTFHNFRQKNALGQDSGAVFAKQYGPTNRVIERRRPSDDAACGSGRQGQTGGDEPPQLYGRVMDLGKSLGGQ
jgi:hypothetical protein